ISPETKILANGAIALQTAELFNSWLMQTNGYALPIVSSVLSKDRYIAFSMISDTSEKYMLKVKRKYMLLEGGAAGLIRGTSTLLQLAYQSLENKNKIPCLTIYDQPQFGYRGVHLDVSRHFLSKEFVKRYIDLLALYKMNTFHWHLTDDQGWRIEILKYPRLTDVGAWRSGSMIGPYRNKQFDSIPYGGYYTQNDIREVVQYASQRQITIIPEIEMPGHSLAALAAYPEYSCLGTVKEVGRAWGGYDDVFCVNDSTFSFLEDVLSEVIELFPSTYIHIGGDECPKERWSRCPKCLNTRFENDLSNEEELQSYFIQRIEKYLNSKGRQIIGWDEILEGGLAPNATVMSWRGIEGGKAAARSGHYAIMTPGTHCYFDHYQGERAAEPLAIGGYTTLEKVYAYRPIPDSLTKEEQKLILGAQANLWTEYMYNEKGVEYMLMPRLCALSEVLWTDTNLLDQKSFFKRVLKNQSLLDSLDVNYSHAWHLPSLKIGEGPKIQTLLFTLESKVPQKIETAWDLGDGVLNFKSYKKPLIASATSTLIVRSTYNQHTSTITYPFEFSKVTNAKVNLITPGERSYANPGSTLVDGITGVFPWTGKHWIGWIGKSPEVEIKLDGKQKVDSIVVVYLHDPGSWIHAPANVSFGETELLFESEKIIPSDPIQRISIPVNKEMNSIHLRFNSIGKNPEGTPGAGQNGWLFVSEILVY
ncbi:MAG: beta-N-acetylhexosaminidase, partial [Bacteroidia bacterium]